MLKRNILLLPLLCVCLLLGRHFFYNRQTAPIAGYSIFIVSSSSMEPEYPVRTLVVAKKESFSNLKVGDMIVFKSTALQGKLAFHRIIRSTEEGFYTKGDNNHHPDNQLITENNYVSKGIGKNYPLGLYLTTINKPSGLILFFLIPMLIFQISIGIIFKKRKKL